MNHTINGTKYHFFWGGPFSNWYESHFELNGTKYNCAEQFMMKQKARLFNDYEMEEKIMATSDPSLQKKYGRRVSGFLPNVWDDLSEVIVKTGLRAKYLQNAPLKKALINHSDCVFVEASPYDRIWGIGYSKEDAHLNINNWGENRLGKILTELSKEVSNGEIHK